MKPPIAYYGAKVTIGGQIAALLPDHEHYVEPFGGSLAVLLAKRPSRMETVNDLDGELMTFWRVLRDRPADLQRACALTPHARAEHLEAFPSSARRAIRVMNARDQHLLDALDAAVQLHILLTRDWPEHRRIDEAKRAAQVIAEKGDVIQYGGRPGETAHAFNALAKGLAAAAYAPGGVTIAGHHWCPDHAVCLRAGTAPPSPAPKRRTVVDLELPS